MLRHVCVAVGLAALGGCASQPEAPVVANSGGSAVLSQAYTTGFFGGVHAFPYANRLQPGRIYATTTKTKGPVFGMSVTEICWSDTEAMRTKYPTEMQVRSYEGESKVTKSMGANGDFGIEGIKLPYLEVGAGANFVNSVKYEFTNIKEIEVEEGTAAFIRANVKENCKALVAEKRRQGHYVFVALKVYQPESSEVAFDFKRNANGALKAQVVEGIGAGIKASGGTARTETRAAANKVVEVKPVSF